MNIVVDTNIVFSALLNTNSILASILMDISSPLVFHSPNYLLTEIDRHKRKLIKLATISSSDFPELLNLVIQNITFIQEDRIAEENWIEAEKLTNHVDQTTLPCSILRAQLPTMDW